MATFDPSSRRTFLRTAALASAGLLGSGAIGRSERLLAAVAGAGPDDPEVPNEVVAKILQDISRGRPITRGHLSLDMPAAAEAWTPPQPAPVVAAVRSFLAASARPIGSGFHQTHPILDPQPAKNSAGHSLPHTAPPIPRLPSMSSPALSPPDEP